MPAAFDPREFDQALAELRFGDAEALAERADEAERSRLHGVIAIERQRSLGMAQRTYQRIVTLGAADDHAGIHATAEDPATGPLLALLPEADRKRADIYLRAAARWAAAGTGKNRRRLAEAERAMREFDLDLARGLLALIDARFVDDEMAETRDRLLLDIEARDMELDSLRDMEQRFSPRSDPGSRRWWQRWRR